MTRMSREFSLVLLGAGVLTAGYFAAPSTDDEVEKKADEKAAARVGDNGHANGTGRHYHGGGIFWVHSIGYAGAGTGVGRPAASPAVSRGGFGGTGRAVGGGGS